MNTCCLKPLTLLGMPSRFSSTVITEARAVQDALLAPFTALETELHTSVGIDVAPSVGRVAGEEKA